MPHTKSHTPISDEEAIEFLERMMDTGNEQGDLDAVFATQSRGAWQEFVSDRLAIERGQDMTNAQFNVLNRGRILKFTELPTLGIQVSTFMSRGKMQTRFRNIASGQFMGRERILLILDTFTFTGR